MACETQYASRLPDDVITEILSFLPAKSIGRFRSMSRSWCAELCSPSFIEFHRRRANNPAQPKLFFSPTFDDYEDEAPDSEDDEEASDSKDEEASDSAEDDDDEASDSENDDEESDSEDEECYFYSWHPGGGSVKKLMEYDFWSPAPLTKPLHGLVLIRGHNLGDGYDVCNPSTGEFLYLPDTRLPLKTIRRYSTQGPLPCYWDVAYGFGYCSVTHEYKAVRIFSSPVFLAQTATTCCEVLVLGVPTCWRPTAQQPPDCVVEEHNPAVFLNGYLHFLCKDGGIVTFSVNDETFGSLSPPPYPNPDPEDDAIVARMTELDGCLCMCREKTKGDSPYQVWLLREYQTQQWEQLCSFHRSAWPEPERMQLQTKWITPLTIMHNGRSGQRKIMFGTGTCRVFTVDLDGTPEVLLIPDEAMSGSIRDSEYYPSVGLFDESLVPLGRIIEEMDFWSPTTQAWSDVLKWLPARSVLELSLVCREWRAMAANPQFHQSHVVHANSVKRHHHIKFVIDPSSGVLWDMDDLHNFPFPPNFTSDLTQCSQPCHGLNVGTFSGMDFLCNPAIRYNQLIEHGDEDVLNNQENISFAGRIALGYDSDNDDHVLVSLAYEEKNMDTRQYKLRCNVRRVYGDKWYVTEPPPRPVANSPPAYADGKIYWVVEPNLGPSSTASCKLVAFDTIEREFEVVEGPPCSYDGGNISVVELHGKIHVAWSDQDTDAIEVWVMEENGTWCVEYRIELAKFSPEYSSERTMIMAIDPTDGRILLNTGRSLGYYNLKTGELETIYRVTSHSVRDDETHFCAVIYHESLFRPFMR